MAFILGREPALSLAEIKAVFENHGFDFTLSHASRDAALVTSRHAVDAQALMEELGGTIKIGTVLDVLKGGIQDPAYLTGFLRKAAQKKKGKFSFGISGYGVVVPVRLGLECKRLLREDSISARYVEGDVATLTAPQIKNYKLDSKGVEVLLIKTKDGVAVARTQAVQPFDLFSQRDYGRPGRDAKSGMLPPKVARMMVNLAHCPRAGLLIDPFCGSGTILTEAALMGFKHIAGSDISKKAVTDTLKNIAWAVNKWGTPEMAQHLTIHLHDARRIHKLFSKHSVSAIVTEPLLGPPLKGNEREETLRSTVKKLKDLYCESLRVFHDVLKKDGRVVMIIPALRSKIQWITPLTREDFEKQKWQLVEPFPGLSWHRPDQLLMRHIVVLRPSL